MKVTKIAVLSDKDEIRGSGAFTAWFMIASRYSADAPPNSGGTHATIWLMTKGLSWEQPKRHEVCLPAAVLEMQHNQPVSLGYPEPFTMVDGKLCKAYFLFRRQVFEASALVSDEAAYEEAVLTVKKHVYAEDTRLARLRQEVQAIEAVVNLQLNKRSPIPETVKLLVWARDEGKCVRCGSSEKLHFDHVIPVSKGGGGSEDNIQILCERCNLQKSDRIGF